MRHRTVILTGIFSHYSDVTVGSIVLFVMIACCPVLLRGKARPDAVPNYRIGPWSLPRVRRTLRTSPTNYYLIGRLTQILPPIDRPCTINKHVRSLSLRLATGMHSRVCSMSPQWPEPGPMAGMELLQPPLPAQPTGVTIPSNTLMGWQRCGFQGHSRRLPCASIKASIYQNMRYDCC